MFTVGSVTPYPRSRNGKKKRLRRGSTQQCDLPISTGGEAFKTGDRAPRSGSTSYQPPREKVCSRLGAPPRPGRVCGFCSLSSVYSQPGSEKGNYWFATATNCSSVSANRIMELLAHNQNRNKLLQPRAPVFDGNPIEYRTFFRAFKNLVESRTFSGTDRLY